MPSCGCAASSARSSARVVHRVEERGVVVGQRGTRRRAVRAPRRASPPAAIRPRPCRCVPSAAPAAVRPWRASSANTAHRSRPAGACRCCATSPARRASIAHRPRPVAWRALSSAQRRVDVLDRRAASMRRGTPASPAAATAPAATARGTPRPRAGPVARQERLRLRGRQRVDVAPQVGVLDPAVQRMRG